MTTLQPFGAAVAGGLVPLGWRGPQSSTWPGQAHLPVRGLRYLPLV